MPNFAANLSMMFNEVDFTERFKAAADTGFKAVEYLFPYDYSCLLYTSPSPRDATLSRMPSSA